MTASASRRPLRSSGSSVGLYIFRLKFEKALFDSKSWKPLPKLLSDALVPNLLNPTPSPLHRFQFHIADVIREKDHPLDSTVLEPL